MSGSHASMTGSHASKTSHQWFEAETGQEVPPSRPTAPSPTSPLSPSTPHGSHGNQSSDMLRSEESTGQSMSTTELGHHGNEGDEAYHQSVEGVASNSSLPRNAHQRQISADNIDPTSIMRPGLKFRFEGQLLSSSIRSLPTSLSPTVATPNSPSRYLGYNPQIIPDITLSQPDLARKRHGNELKKLQRATVKVWYHMMYC